MSSSLMLTDPNRFATAQRMAQAFATSEMVPETLRGSMPNCLVALMLADEMGESPLMVMQNIFFVGGRAGWQAQYMIARANKSGKFRGPLRWRSEGTGADLAVTCFADLADVADEPRIEVTVTMAMAKADGWTRNKKYETLPEQMLRWRSAAWLIRLYAPEAMFGLPTADELEDTMKDVTPPKLGIDDFKPSSARKPAPVIDHEGEGPGEAVSTYNLVDADGVAHSYDAPESAFEAMRTLLLAGRDARGRDGLNAAWADMQPAVSALRDSDRPHLAEEIDAYYDQLLRPLPVPRSQKPADEPPAPEQSQEPEPALPLSVTPPMPRGKPDWSRWRQQFDADLRRCRFKDELTQLIAANFDAIADYNHAFPRAAGIFAAERTKRMEELPDG